MGFIGFLRELLFDVWLKKNGGHTATYEEAEQAYKEGKIVNLVEKFPDIFGDGY